MKLLYTRKQFQGMVEKYQKMVEDAENRCEKFRTEWYDLNVKINKLENKCSKLEETNKYHQELITIRDKDIEQISKKYKEMAGAKGGFIAQINALTRKLEDAQEKFDKYKEEKELEIADLKSDRYLRVKPATKNRKPNQKMMLYSKQRTSNIIKNVKENI